MEEHGFAENACHYQVRRRSGRRSALAVEMSDSDVDERVSADFASIFALAKMQGEADASSSTHVAQQKMRICSPSDFNPPSPQDLDWNVKVEKEKLLQKTAAFENGKMQVGTALVGRISKDIALPLYETSLQHMDLQNGGAKIMSTDGKSRFETIFPGITDYGLHIGNHDRKAQRCATILIEGPFLATAEAAWKRRRQRGSGGGSVEARRRQRGSAAEAAWKRRRQR
jgi:hypothetical protein